MAVFDLYSKRNKPVADVFSYDELPAKLRRQIIYVWQKFFNQFKESHDSFSHIVWQKIHMTLKEEYGVKYLVSQDINRYADSYNVEFFLESTDNLEKNLDVVYSTPCL